MNGIIKLSIASLLSLSLFPAYAQNINIDVLSATVKDEKISDANILLQRNGGQTLTATTNVSGSAQVNSPSADNSDNLLIIKKEGYSTLVVKCPCDGMSYALSPVMKGLDSIRVVLTWGATPKDLDSHMVYPNNHIYFSQKTGEEGNLDVDDTDSFGPETVTLNKKLNGQDYVYAVHDFSDGDNPNTPNLSASQAKVFVYVGESLVRTYYVPTGKIGNLWTVFKINKTGDIEDINEFAGMNTEASSVANKLQPWLGNAAVVSHASLNSADIEQVKNLNLQGEKAYQDKNLELAISLFTQAINIDAENGKAYGNLGLVYQKAGRTAEAIWANRKAIALASGPKAATIRAGANYNIARIYEAAGQNADALRYYQLAKAEKNNPVYDTAIERVSHK
ncbi:Predicted O-linked N-acetylglucosamine transferase%2C SPINDLY family [Yersinia massiliensis]|uniref:Predicted O-linked N-acetylglucosamine transferase, SPINDLY family n=1 Tax=Yersinia intermedia TaxID=631 RepID=A0A0H5MIF7_YERIN|nr:MULTISPECIES: tetratricopeptide repeat protein [Yersinia]CNI13533.1 Predicted O-linked N-acetylglucosamine transferase%2C SPINDLY family [Yersinia massiliensis]CRY56886.1 Predicted O-linked N-acetylglucosamine transferase%2C SPINDLY family [Yersinia intermedia]